MQVHHNTGMSTVTGSKRIIDIRISQGSQRPIQVKEGQSIRNDFNKAGEYILILFAQEMYSNLLGKIYLVLLFSLVETKILQQ